MKEKEDAVLDAGKYSDLKATRYLTSSIQNFHWRDHQSAVLSRLRSDLRHISELIFHRICWARFADWTNLLLETEITWQTDRRLALLGFSTILYRTPFSSKSLQPADRTWINSVD